MRAISLWQPWASAVALGLKSIETRHWSTDFRGRLAIHAAKRWTEDERDMAQEFARRYDRRLATPPLGAIVATCRMVDCQRTERLRPSAMENDFGNYGPSRFGWIFTDVKALAAPIPFRGAQGFFQVDDELLGLPVANPRQGSLL